MDIPSGQLLSRPRSRSSAVARLEKLGLHRDIDLLLHLPLRYEDETQVWPIRQAHMQAAPGQVWQVEGVVQSSEIIYRPRRCLLIRITDEEDALHLRFLNFYSSQVGQMAVGVRVRVRGEVREGLFGLEMVHPSYKVVVQDEVLPQTLTPVYPTTAGLGQAYLRKAILSALARTTLPEILPQAVLDQVMQFSPLWSIADAVKFLHQPPPDISLASLEAREHPAWQRIKFDELLAQQLSLKRAHHQRRMLSAPALPQNSVATSLLMRLLDTLPFVLTDAQQKVWREMSVDLTRTYPMQRLLQGDVGSGKTVVAALAATQAIDAHYQVALMVPTELLAEQHFRKMAAWLTPLGIKVVWLAGGMRTREKREVQSQIATGEVQLVIGTHALIQKGIDFARLGLVIVDEQHRFGVGQRLALRELGRDGVWPHQLMMSATPIPRTLAMTYYADLDVSVIDALPPGRTPVVTRLVNDKRRMEVMERVRAAARLGRQIYWVCPLIEESEALQLQTAVETHALLSELLPELTVGLVHGRLPAAEKAAVMQAFSEKTLQLLVATTVIEVGVDVPNASLMVIEHAERFGLAQLHQLRGRVGRGSEQSACVLLYQTPLSAQAKQRLATMRETNDGFVVAQRDLAIRGPGEFLGARQSGQVLLRFVDLALDAQWIAPTSDAAAVMLAQFPRAVEAHLQRWLGVRDDYLKT